MKNYEVTHEIRQDGAIGIFTHRIHIVQANNEEEARDKARQHWNSKGYRTRGVWVKEMTTERVAEAIGLLPKKDNDKEEEATCTECGIAPVTRNGTPRLWEGLCEDCYTSGSES